MSNNQPNPRGRRLFSPDELKAEKESLELSIAESAYNPREPPNV